MKNLKLKGMLVVHDALQTLAADQYLYSESKGQRVLTVVGGS